MKISERKFENVDFIKIDNELGMVLELSSFGASIYDLQVVDKKGNLESVVLTPSELSDFFFNDGYHGKCVGRYSGRIDNSKCVINDVAYNLERNWNGVNALHGGSFGISFKNFSYKFEEKNEYLDVIFQYVEPENDLPGDVSYTITYRISKQAKQFRIIFNANTNKDTIVNLTNHSYFNLSGNAKSTILNHDLTLNCDKYTRLDNNLITISIDKVNKVMDFTKGHKIGKYINDSSLQDHQAKGYDHCFIKADNTNPLIAILEDKKSGRKLSVSTSYPAIVCYACNYPKPFKFNKEKIDIEKHHSICLECQYIPNGINMENVNKAILLKDETFDNYIEYSFEK